MVNKGIHVKNNRRRQRREAKLPINLIYIFYIKTGYKNGPHDARKIKRRGMNTSKLRNKGYSRCDGNPVISPWPLARVGLQEAGADPSHQALG